MSYIPTINEIYQNIANDLKSKLNLSDDGLKKVLDVFALVLAGQLKLTYLNLSDIQKNVFPDTADSVENGGTLERHGLIHLNRLRRPATNSILQISVIGEIGSTLRAGLTFKSNDDSVNPGNLYVLDIEKTITANPDSIEIRSLTSGFEANLEIGNTLTITEPVIGVNQIVEVSAVTEQGLQEESIDDYRKAIIDSIQLEAQGGAKTDYRLWAKDAQGVKDVYPFVKEGSAGFIQVFVEATVLDSVDGYGTPSQTILDEVAEVIEFDPDISKPTYERGRRPIQAFIEVLPIAVNPVDVQVIGLTQNNADITNSIRTNIETFLGEIRPFVAGGDLARNKNDILYAAKIQSILTDVLEADNFFSDLNVLVNGVQQTTFLFSKENIPYLRNLTFE